ncbi:MAG: hypothetical protein L6R38_006647 [Xanthoria sp. 2 TBL-2021]|nr:MAG: hypothetical protein L6R38_006647 [Xanthoria sp. 2 TBL-2021]
MARSISLKQAYWFLAACGALYVTFISILCTSWAQKHALYVHKLHTLWWHDLDKPEQFGFLKNQVQPLHITTPDGEVLYAWHIVPIAKYIANEEYLIKEQTISAAQFQDSVGFDLLSKDPNSRLVINFHGNAGTVAQGWRTDAYRSLSSGAPDKIHVLAIDYRGFGLSTGTPDEQGLITDGIATVKWAIDVAKIPPERIVLVGQSLGTAVAAAVAEHFVRVSKVEFAGVVLIAAFSDLPTLMLTYSIKGLIPILSPLRPYPRLQRFFSGFLRDTWNTSSRITNLVRKSQKVNLHLIHSKDDFDISWKHSESLFYAAANATSTSGLSIKQIEAVKLRQDLHEGGSLESWNSDGMKKIAKQIVRYGGHNRITTYPCIARTVQHIFEP